MDNRRQFLKNCILGAGMVWGGDSLLARAKDNPEDEDEVYSSVHKIYHMPNEEAEHEATWMAFGGTKEIWGREGKSVREALVRISKTIVAHEPVFMLARTEDMELAKKMLDSRVKIVEGEFDDFWVRDTAPVFVVDEAGKVSGIDFNFNGWGSKPEFKQPYELDGTVAEQICNHTHVSRIITSLVLEGGALEVDGEGTAIITESCVLNSNRNPGLSKKSCEAELKRLLSVKKIIWLPGIRGYDITDGHTDFYARFVAPNVVVAHYDSDPNSYDHKVTLENLKILRKAHDAKGRRLEVHVLEAPHKTRQPDNDDFSAGYINYYVCNGAIICPEFGDNVYDEKAHALLAGFFPDRVIEMVDIDPIAAGGGGIHCTTQQQPKA